VRPLDSRPQRVDLALGRQQIAFVGLIAQHLAVAEVDQLQQVGHSPGAAPQDQCVEPHLEQRLGLDVLTGRTPGLVVDDPYGAGWIDVDPVDVAPQQQPGVEDMLDVQLALRRLQAARILEVEVGLEQRPALGQPLDQVGALVIAQNLRELRFLRQDPVHGRTQEVERRLRSPVPGRKVEEALQHRVHDRATHGRGAWSLGQLVDDAEPVEQGTGHEVRRPAR